LIGVATDDLRRDQAGFLGSLVALSLVGSLVAVGAILVLSRRFGNRMVSQLDQIIDKSPVGMATIDFATGRVLRLNKQFENTFRWNLGDLPDIDSWFVRAYPDPDYRREVQGDWAAVTADSLNKGTPVPSFLLSVHCGDGADRAVLVSTAVFDGTAVVTFVDRTEQKKAERELLDLNQSLEEKVRSRSQELERTYRELADTEKMAALGQLAAGMAHELNTPLGAIQSANGINQDYLRHRLANELKLLPTLSPPEQAYLDWLEAKNRKLAEAVPGLPDRSLRRRMVQSLAVGGWDVDDDLAEYALELGLSEGELAELALSPRKQWVFQLSRNLLVLQRMTWVVSEGVSRATHVVDALRRYLKGKDEDLARFVVADQLETILALFHHKLRLGVEVSTSFDRGAVVGDPQRLNQVWMNLIHNALQAMDFKGTLGIRVLRTAEGTVVEVADSGPGIPESIQHRIFEPYFTTKKHGEGLGLGLDLCRKIIDDHHGTLTFRSRPGETVFTVTLPAPEEP
jgi:signal transduction histidine kinase